MSVDKVMFEIYREADYNRRYRVVYFTELGEHNREHEINRAIAGDHFFDGFLARRSIDAAKIVVHDIVSRLNSGDAVTPGDARMLLMDFLVE